MFRISNFAFASPPPTTNRSDVIAAAFTNLANSDASVREKARVDLLGLSRDELKVVRKLVEKSRPLAPSQALALHEIVAHVFLASEPYQPAAEGSGFLGVRFDPSGVSLDLDNDETQLGAVIIERMPGFCAYRFLRNGDVIVGITKAPNRPIRQSDDLRSIISMFKAGQKVRLQIIRGGQRVEVQIKLDARPDWAGAVPIGAEQIGRDAIRERQRRADDYWQQEFAPLIDDGVL